MGSALRDYACACIWSYGHGVASVGSRTPWSADVLLRRKAAFKLMIGKNQEQDRIRLLETLKDETESNQIKSFLLLYEAVKIYKND